MLSLAPEATATSLGGVGSGWGTRHSPNPGTVDQLLSQEGRGSTSGAEGTGL